MRVDSDIGGEGALKDVEDGWAKRRSLWSFPSDSGASTAIPPGTYVYRAYHGRNLAGTARAKTIVKDGYEFIACNSIIGSLQVLYLGVVEACVLHVETIGNDSSVLTPSENPYCERLGL